MTSTARLDYPLHEHTLGNGLRVVVNPDHATPVVAVNLWYDVGSRDERPGQTGLAHLFEHLMFQGSTHVGSGEHLSALQDAGGSCNATTWFDRTNYFETVPTSALDLALWLEADRMRGLLDALTQENLDNQRDVVKEEKRQRYDNAPYGDLLVHLLDLAFPADHPYRHPVIGSMEDLDAAALADVRAFFSRWYAPGNAVLTLAGDIEPVDGFARVERYFGTVPAREVTASAPPGPLPPFAGTPRAEVSGAVPASLLTLCWRTPAGHTREADATDLALEVLGGSETSRLHRRLVRTDRLCTSAGASALGLTRGSSLGFTQARALDGISLDTVEQVIVDEIDRLCEEGPSQGELDRIRTQFEREWLSQCARVEARADLLSASATIDRNPDRINTRIVEYCSIGVEEVREAARTHLLTEHRATLAYLHTSSEGEDS
ncbi:MAG: M16 family metallopeptidase [Propioniciclava sp.]